MSQTSAVQFNTPSRIHAGLPVSNLGRSVQFYGTLFGRQPTKTRPGYAKFELADPPFNLALNESNGETAPNNSVSHFGIQVQSTETVQRIAERLVEAGLSTRVEENVTCCYAVQNKVWATDPDGTKWEVYVLLSDDGAHHESSAEPCCGEDCCSERTPQGAAVAACC